MTIRRLIIPASVLDLYAFDQLTEDEQEMAFMAEKSTDMFGFAQRMRRDGILFAAGGKRWGTETEYEEWRIRYQLRDLMTKMDHLPTTEEKREVWNDAVLAWHSDLQKHPQKKVM